MKFSCLRRLLAPTFASVSVVWLSGCVAAYHSPEKGPTASFSVGQENDVHGTTLITVAGFSFADASCADNPDGTRLGTRMNNSSSSVTDPVRIAAARPFTFTVSYIDARLGANRQCWVTGTFTPEAEHRYVGKIFVTDALPGCSLGVYDLASGDETAVPFEMPELVCESGGNRTRKNGQSLRTKWKVVPAVR